jgi:uncharacterized membrane protein
MRRIILILVAAGLFTAWLLYTPSGLFGKADALGYAVCHRIEERSFQAFGRALPLCARCSGMYLGALLGLGYQMLTARRRSGMPSVRVWFVLAVLVGAFGFDGVNSFAQLLLGEGPVYAPHNTLRLLTGTGMGLVMAVLLYPAFIMTAWRKVDPAPAIPSLRAIGVLILLGLGLDALVLLEIPVVLAGLGLVSALGVWVVLALVHTLAWLMILRREEAADRLQDLAGPFLAGLTSALLMIFLIDIARFTLTGTWGGFPLF